MFINRVQKKEYLYASVIVTIAALIWSLTKNKKSSEILPQNESFLRDTQSSNTLLAEKRISRRVTNTQREGSSEYDFSWVTIPIESMLSEKQEGDFERTLTEEQYFSQSKLQPHAPYWWYGTLGTAWRDQYGWRPKLEIQRIIDEIEITAAETAFQGKSLISNEEPARTQIRMYRSFDKAFDDGHFGCPQSELSWLDEKKYYLLYESSSKETTFKKGVAIRKGDGAVFKWELD